MKVKDILKKVNYATAKIPVYLQEGFDPDVTRKAISFDFAGYYTGISEATVTQIELQADRIIIHYKGGDKL